MVVDCHMEIGDRMIDQVHGFISGVFMVFTKSSNANSGSRQEEFLWRLQMKIAEATAQVTAPSARDRLK